MAADSAVVALSRSAVAKGGVAGTSQRAVSRLAGEARWRALLIHVAATLALLTLLIPFPASAQAAGFAVLAAVAYVPGAALWLRASRLGRLELTSVTAAGAALAAAAMAAAARRPAGAAASLSLTRNAWLIAACCVIAGAVAVRRLIVELRHRVHL